MNAGRTPTSGDGSPSPMTEAEYHPSTQQQGHSLPVKIRALFYAFLVVALLAVSLGVTSVAYLALQAAESSKENGMVLEKVEQTNKRLIDCTTPQGECYQDGQKRTGQAIVGINEGTLRVIAAALSCQEDGFTEQRDLARCTTRRASK